MSAFNPYNRQAAEDHERFMSNTYIMHLGM